MTFNGLSSGGKNRLISKNIEAIPIAHNRGRLPENKGQIAIKVKTNAKIIPNALFEPSLTLSSLSTLSWKFGSSP